MMTVCTHWYKYGSPGDSGKNMPLSQCEHHGHSQCKTCQKQMEKIRDSTNKKKKILTNYCPAWKAKIC
jgi:hypothetical protein